MDDKKDDKKGAAPIPTLKDSKSAPQLRLKGLSQGGMSLLERLKQFKKKDLAFILAGLGVLFLAPLAEHFMMAPEGDQGGFQAGFGSDNGNNVFGKGGSPYEPGVNGLAPGDLAGSGSDVITPLNVRDPASLIMGPGGTQQPPATSTPAPTAPPAKESNDWKDALAQSAARAAGAATAKAALPVPKIGLSGGGLRGLGEVSGGGGGSYSLPPLSAAGVPNRGNVGNSPSALASSGYRGAARGLSQGGDNGSLEALKKAAGQQGGLFNSGNSASNALEQAASQAMPGGTSSGGEGSGGGGGNSAPGGDSAKGSKNADGQSLAFLAAKENQEKAIDLAWKVKEAGNLDLMWYKLRDKMAEEAIMTPFKAITGQIAKGIKNFGTGAGTTLICHPYGVTSTTDPKWSETTINDNDVSQCNQVQDPNKDGDSTGNTALFARPLGASSNGDLDTSTLYGDAPCTQPVYSCGASGANGKPTNPPDNGAVSGLSGGVYGDSDFNTLCTTIIPQLTQTQPGRVADPNIASAATALKNAAQPLAQASAALNTGESAGLSCGATAITDNFSGTPLHAVLGIDQTGTPQSSPASPPSDTWNTLNDAYTKVSNVVQRDFQASGLAVNGQANGQQSTSAQTSAPTAGGGSGAEGVWQLLEDVRGKVTANPAQDASASVKSIGTLNTTVGALFKDQTVDPGLTTARTELDKLATDTLPQMKRALGEVQSALSNANTAVGNAQTAVNTLKNGANASMGSTMGTYLSGLQKTQSDLGTKLQVAISEYNRQAAANTGLLPQLKSLQATVVQFNPQVEKDLLNPGQSGSGQNVSKSLPDLAAKVPSPSVTKDNFQTWTGMPSSTQIQSTLNPFNQDLTNANNANSGSNPPTVQSINGGGAMNAKSTDPGTAIAN